MSTEKNNISILVKTVLCHSSYRSYNVQIAKELGGIEIAVVLMDMLDQYNYLLKEDKLISHGENIKNLMYYTESQAWERLAVHVRSFNNSIRVFEQLGFFKTFRFGMPYKRHFLPDFLKIEEWFSKNFSSHAQKHDKSCSKAPPVMPKGTTEDLRALPIYENETYPRNLFETIPNENEKKSNSSSSDSSFKNKKKEQKEDILSLDEDQLVTWILEDFRFENGAPIKGSVAFRWIQKYGVFAVRDAILYYQKMNKIETKLKPEAYVEKALMKNYATLDNKRNFARNEDLKQKQRHDRNS